MIPRNWIEKWCKYHNAALIQMCDKGFVYQTHNGITWYIPYDEIDWKGAEK